MCSSIRQGQGLGREALFCVSVSNFPCYNKKSHHLLEIWLVPKCSGQVFAIPDYLFPDLFRCAMCESAQPAFKA